MELERARTGSVLCDLAGCALIEASGADAESFLHAQLSSDVRGLALDRCQLSTYNTPKGRVLATLLLWRAAEGFLVQLPRAIAESVCKRLSMYVLRSKVGLILASDRYVRIGIAGPAAASTLAGAGLTVPAADFGLAAATDASDRSDVQPDWLLRLPGSRFEAVFAQAERAIAFWEHLETAGAYAGTGAGWHWASIRSGIAQVGAGTQDEFVLQMLNYELLGAVSFTKGCYPGQEIVARTQYRGEIKRRTLLLHAQSDASPAAAQPIYAAGSQQPVGMVLDAAAAPPESGGFDLLACVHLDLAGTAELRLASPDGCVLERLDLPYSVPGAA